MAARRGGGRDGFREEPGEIGKYRIGTVATLTGLSPHTIRAWESRYGLIAPLRSGGGLRLYSEDDVTRLQLLRALTERGEPIGSVANLPDAALRERLTRHAESERGLAASDPGIRRRGPLRVALLDPSLAEQIQMRPTDSAGREVVVRAADLDDFLAQLATARPDLLILNLDRLGGDPVSALERSLAVSGARTAVVVYTFAPRRRLAALVRSGARLIQLPLSVELLWRTLDAWLAIRRSESTAAPARAPAETPAEVVPRRFSDAELARLREVASSVECECPNHLSGLVASLAAFEHYSRQCQVENPADERIHGVLAEGTGRARVLMEQLLAHLCDHDGIHLGPLGDAAER